MGPVGLWDIPARATARGWPQGGARQISIVVPAPHRAVRDDVLVFAFVLADEERHVRFMYQVEVVSKHLAQRVARVDRRAVALVAAEPHLAKAGGAELRGRKRA